MTSDLRTRMTVKRLFLSWLFTTLAWAASDWKGWWLTYILTGIWVVAFVGYAIGLVILYRHQRGSRNG